MVCYKYIPWPALRFTPPDVLTTKELKRQINYVSSVNAALHILVLNIIQLQKNYFLLDFSTLKYLISVFKIVKQSDYTELLKLASKHATSMVAERCHRVFPSFFYK